MIKALKFSALIVLLFSISTAGQVPVATHIAILKAEDSLDYGKAIEDLLKSPNDAVKVRAALAAGRIGDRAAIRPLTSLLEKERSAGVRAMAAFALGEIESLDAADAILTALKADNPAQVRARLVEAAGKIAAANAGPPNAEKKDPKVIQLGDALLDALEAEDRKAKGQDKETIILGLTAALRVRPEGTDGVAAKFLTNMDARVRADAANVLSRIRAKNANTALRTILLADDDAVARANAARALGAAEDKASLDLLIEAATGDDDSRVRVSAIRSLAQLKDKKAAEPLLKHGNALLEKYKKETKPNFIPNEHSELLEITVALGQLMPNTFDDGAVAFLRSFGELDEGFSPEIYIARLRIAPGRGDKMDRELADWRQYSTMAQLIGEFASVEPTNDEGKQMKAEAPNILKPLAEAYAVADPNEEGKRIFAGPDVLRAYARFKTDDLDVILRRALSNKDVFIRTAAANLLGQQPASKENTDALRSAFTRSLVTDKHDNDAQLATLSALNKLDAKASVGSLLTALNSPDFLVRDLAFELLSKEDLQKDFPGIRDSLDDARKKRGDKVLPLKPAYGTKLGQILNTNADYRRAAARKNGSVKAVFTTQKGTFTIDLLPEDAPLTVDNFIKLANAKYFDGLEVHRVVPNFVMQDGDPLGNGSGGPGWSIRCEVNMLPYERGVVGMALSGKHTGGSQWFVTHSPQPHLDGGYTVFGKVNENDMKVVDNIVRGDKILSVRIIGK
ncbi:MAG: HEAT repeat domain-containing protein [Acidobacteria bacterium]|nr:HEAT repeat domain-containing protein [Acidobacteriota bacterium]